jgi:hypothetical protein
MTERPAVAVTETRVGDEETGVRHAAEMGDVVVVDRGVVGEQDRRPMLGHPCRR